MNGSRTTIFHILSLAAAVAAVFSTVVGHGFVWDDSVLLLGRTVYRQFDLAGMFLQPGNGVEYLPLRDLSYALDYALWGERPFGFHLTNLLLYAGNVIAVYFLTRKLLSRVGATAESASGWAALAGALLFAVHPLHSEAACFITCRNVLLSGLFFFLALHAYLQADQGERLGRGAYGASLAWFVAALLSKATVIILPLILLLPPFSDLRKAGRRRLLQIAPFFAVSAAFFLAYRAIGQESGIIDPSHQGFTSSSALDRIATAVQIPWFYLGKFFVPSGLSANYDVTFGVSWTAPAVWGSLLGLLAVGCGIGYLSRSSRIPLFVAGWYFVTLLPVLNFFATVPVVADRYAYLPLFALSFVVSAAVARWMGRAPVAAFAGVVVIVAGLGSLSVLRNGVWHSDRTLWEATMKTSPRHIKNRVNLATVYFLAKEYDRSLALLEVTKEQNHYYDYYHLFQGHLAVERGDLQGGVAAFGQALDKDDTFLPALFAVAETSDKMKEYDRAVEYYNRTLLSTELDTNRYRESARAALQRLLVQLNPDIEGRRRQVKENSRDLIGRMLLAEKLGEFGQYDEALVNFLEMERLGLGTWKLYSSIAKTYIKLRDYPLGAAYLEKSLSLNPDNVENLNLLAIVYKKLGRHREALPLLERAIALGDPLGYAAFNRALTYYQMGSREESIRAFGDVRSRYPVLAPKVGAYLAELAAFRPTP